VLPDVPEQLKAFAVLPKRLRLWLFRKIPKFIKNRVPILRQNNIRHAAHDLGWRGGTLVNTFDLLKADLTIVNDLPDYYPADKFPPNVKITGPLFSAPDDASPADPEILKVFDSKISRPKIFCTLSSSGSGEMLKPVIKVFTFGDGLNWNAVILSPHFSVDRAREILGRRDGVYITDKFIPALKVNKMADITVCHGGQGTLQTALVAGTPVVGTAAQQEQFINLSNIESRGAGIRVPLRKWSAGSIQKSICRILENDGFKESASVLQNHIRATNGAQNAADVIWHTILRNR
jgi:UDP:flavonoid glycosyltransferase YjiC (YdhE family)